jgi:hypothetical protein
MLLVPYAAHAQLLSQGSFCNNLESVKERVMQRHTERARTHAERRSGIENRFEERKTARFAQLAENRAKADETRWAGYARVEGLTKTSAGAAAVAAFRERVEASVEARRATIDDAIDAFETTAASLWEDRETDADSIAADMKAEIEALFDETVTACRQSENPGDVRAGLREDIKSLAETYRERTRSLSGRDQYDEAKDALRAVSKEAWEVFHAEVAEARAELRIALGAARPEVEDDAEEEEVEEEEEEEVETEDDTESEDTGDTSE